MGSRRVLAVACLAACAAGQCIVTIAGRGSATNGYAGDGGPASAALLTAPLAVTLDGAGGYYIADGNNNAIRWVSSSGVITTVAGVGPSPGAGYTGDNGPATRAKLNMPSSLILDGAGGFMFTDRNNQAVRRVNAGGTITTIAGGNGMGYTGNGGPATLARIGFPRGIASDGAGGYWFTEESNCAIRFVNASGFIQTVAGLAASGYSGNGGFATSAYINSPLGICNDGMGGFYFADAGNNVIRRVDTGGIINAAAGSGTSGSTGDGGVAVSATLYNPTGVSLDTGGGYVIADTSNSVIRRVSAAGIISLIAGVVTGTGTFAGDGGPATFARLGTPTTVISDGYGGYLIADHGNHAIRYVTPPGMCGASTTGCVIQAAGVICSITNVAPYFQVAVYLNGNPCVNVSTPPAFNRTAVCPFPNTSTPTLLWLLPSAVGSSQMVTISAQFDAAIRGTAAPPWINATAIAAPSFGWGSSITFALSYSGAATLGTVLLRPVERDDVIIPCFNRTVARSGALMNVTCSLLLWSDSWLSGGLRVMVTQAASSMLNSSATVVLPGSTVIVRTSGRLVPSLLSVAGGDNVIMLLPLALPSAAAAGTSLLLPGGGTCNGATLRASLRCWVGGTPCAMCTWFNATAILCVSPPGSALYARVTAEVCGLFNVTSDSAAPDASISAISPSMLSQYASYDPTSSTTVSVTTVVAPQAVSPQTLVLAVTPPGVPFLITSVALNGSACVIRSVFSSLLSCIWTLPLPIEAYAPNASGIITVRVQLSLRNQTVALPAPFVAIALLSRVRSITSIAPAPGSSLGIVADWVNVDSTPFINVYFSVPSVSCASPAYAAPYVYCILPLTVPVTTPGYPVLPVYVVNSRGTSITNISIVVPPPAAVTVLQSNVSRTALPSSAASLSIITFPFSISPPLVVQVAGAQQASCSCSISSFTCPPQPSSTASYIYGSPVISASTLLTAAAPTLVGAAAFSVGLPSTSASVTTSPQMYVSSRLGCVVNITTQCVDSQGRLAVAAAVVAVVTTSMSASWTAPPATPLVALPGSVLPSQSINVRLFNVSPAANASAVAALMSCSASVSTPSALPAFNAVLSATAAAQACAVSVDAASGNISALCSGLVLPLTTPLNTSMLIAAQCMFIPSQEVLTLPPLIISLPPATVVVAPPAPSAVEAYAPFVIAVG